MEEFDSGGRRRNIVAPEATADWLRKMVRPNVAATFTLLQSRRVQNGRLTYWLKGDEVEYGWAYNNLIHDLSQRFNGRAYRRFAKLVPNCGALEGDGAIKRHHIHAAFRCPERIEISRFIEAIEFYWSNNSPWKMGDIKIEPITDGWVGYTLKEGSEALLLSGTSF